MQGRTPKATWLKVSAGNPDKRPIERDSVQPESAIPDWPDHLDEIAQG